MMAKTEDPVLTAMTAEAVKVKTMGRAPPVVQLDDLPPPGQRMPPDAFRGGPTASQLKKGQQKQQRRPATANAKVELHRQTFRSNSAQKQRPATAQQQRGSILEMVRPLSSMAQRQVQQLNGGQPSPTMSQTRRPLSAAAMFGELSLEKEKKEIDTFKSNVPLKWSSSAAEPAISSYSDFFGRPGMTRFSGSQMSAVRYKEITCPIGAVDKHTALTPFRALYPVPNCYVQTLPFPRPDEDETTNTIYRRDFYARPEKDTLRSNRDAAWNMDVARKVTLKSEIPLGKNGFGTLHKWQSEHQAEYVGHVVDIRGDRERAEALKVCTSGPTASTGAVTASHMRPRAATARASVGRRVAV